MAEVALIVDTSIHGAAVALYGFGEFKLRDVELSQGVTDSARLLPSMVRNLLARNGMRLSDIHSLVVSRGPGSFTGIRVGISFVLGVYEGIKETGTSVKLAGTSSLQCLAEEDYKAHLAPTAIFLASTKTTGYVATGNGHGSSVLPVDCANFAMHASEWFAPDVRWRIIGDWPQLVDLNHKRAGSGAIETLEVEMVVNQCLLSMGRKIDDWMSQDWIKFSQTDAIYLRKSSVEEKAEQEKNHSH